MYLNQISLQNFRSYTKSRFVFNSQTTFILGPNTSGKSNLMEAIYLLASGKSFRAEKDANMVAFGKEIGRVSGSAEQNSEVVKLEVMVTTGMVAGIRTQFKKFMINGVAKRRSDFVGMLPAVIFCPSDLDIIILSPSFRREFLDSVLEQVDREYRSAKSEYDKGIRQRNALLQVVKESGRRNSKHFEYWDELVIRTGQEITKKREEFIAFINSSQKDILDIQLIYDKSVISKERLAQYEREEGFSGVTLVGPHRDDFIVNMLVKKERVDIRNFGSRGQQRLAVVQLKLLQIQYIEKLLGLRPILLLDDIFSELDDDHINLVTQMITYQQTIISTTHKEFIGRSHVKDSSMIELKL